MIRRLAKSEGWDFEWSPGMGKGSHGVLVVNGKRTIIRNLKDELKTGTYHGMLSQLGLKDSDLKTVT